MKLDWASGATFAVFLAIGIAGGMAMHLKCVELTLFMALLALIGVAAAAVIMYFKSRNQKPAAAAAAPEPGSNSEIDGLVREADRRLAHANAGATIANLPLKIGRAHVCTPVT